MRFSIISSLIAIILTVTADTNAQNFSVLQSKYLSLRNTDVSVSKRIEWTGLAKAFEQYAKTNSKSKDAGHAIFNAAIIYLELFKTTADKNFIDKSLGHLESIPRDFPGNEFADDALLKVGDIYVLDLEDKDSGEKRYLEILDAYPESEMVTVAKARLQRLKNDEPILGRKDSTERSSRLPLVIIDPGHGGEDFGAVGKTGVMEKDVVLDISQRLESLIEEDGTLAVRLTRHSDTFIPLTERTNLVNDFDARLFLSLHVNASTSNKVTGIETYYLDNTNDKSSQRLAERENQYFADIVGGNDLSFIISDLIQNAKLKDSIALAHIMQKNLVARMSKDWGTQKSLGVKKAPFYVLVGAHIPCALVEMYFINNPKDEQNLANPKFRESLAQGLLLGIKDFLSRESR